METDMYLWVFILFCTTITGPAGTTDNQVVTSICNSFLFPGCVRFAWLIIYTNINLVNPVKTGLFKSRKIQFAIWFLNASKWHFGTHPLEKSVFPFEHGTCQDYILVLVYGKTENMWMPLTRIEILYRLDLNVGTKI